MNDSDYIGQFLEFLSEERNMEYKQSTPWLENEFKAKITKTILALSNIRDGGNILIGIRELEGGLYESEGVCDEHYETYTKDEMTSYVSSYADPYVRFEIYKSEISSKKFVMIRVYEFDEIPVVCKKDFNSEATIILRKGATYTRSYGKPQTIEVPSQNEMRELLDMATEKKVRRLMEMSKRIGLPIQSELSEKDKFDNQIRELISDD